MDAPSEFTDRTWKKGDVAIVVNNTVSHQFEMGEVIVCESDLTLRVTNGKRCWYAGSEDMYYIGKL